MLHQQITDTRAIHYQEATALAALIRTKQLSSRECWSAAVAWAIAIPMFEFGQASPILTKGSPRAVSVRRIVIRQ